MPRHYPLYILDMDGTLFRGDSALAGAVEAVAELRRRGSRILFLTNNSSATVAQYKAKLRHMGFDAEEEEIISSATGTAERLRADRVDSVFVIGDPGLSETLTATGIRLVTGPPTPEPAAAVVAGICRELSYELLSDAMAHILAGARFVATNTDATYPVEAGRLIPGAGAIVAAVQSCSGAIPEVIGKPQPYLIELALARVGVSPADALVVGDRIETDIASGVAAGCPTHLVLTGVATVAPPGQPFSADLRGLL